MFPGMVKTALKKSAGGGSAGASAQTSANAPWPFCGQSFERRYFGGRVAGVQPAEGPYGRRAKRQTRFAFAAQAAAMKILKNRLTSVYLSAIL